MYSSQRLYHPSNCIYEVSQCASEILHLGREIVHSGHLERKFIVFPLFMAGFVSRTREERQEIVELIRKLEEDSVGRNVVAARQLLEIVNERQAQRRVELRRQRMQSKGVPDGWSANVAQGWEDEVEDVDWVSIIGESGLQVVNCRL